MLMRWRWPPENSWGKRWTCWASRPTTLMSSRTRSCRWALSVTVLWMIMGSSTILPQVLRGSREE